MRRMLTEADATPGATVFGYYVNDPERYGVVSSTKRARRCRSKKNLPAPSPIMR